MKPNFARLLVGIGLFHLPLFAAEPAAEIDARLVKLTKEQPAAVIILVSRDGQVLHEKALGFSDLEKRTEATLATKFRIGSVTKQFTATAILRLAEQKKLSLDDPLASYFPGLPNAEKITLRHLLTHTSGLKNYTEKPEFLTQVLQPISPEKLIASLSHDAPAFAPGAGWSYCNTGYFLLGEIVAKVSGKPYGEYLRAEFFEPLGMKDTGVFHNDAPPAGAALGYTFSDGKLRRALDWDMSWTGGAGALYSTVGDLNRWNEAIFRGRLLSAASLKAAHTPVVLPPGVQGLHYGFGWVIGDLRGVPIIEHSGGLNGFQSYLLRCPAQNLTVAVLINAEAPPPGLVAVEIGRQLAEKYLGDDLQPLPTVDPKVDPKTYAEYAGEYDYGSKIMTLTDENGHLFAQLQGQSRFEIFPSALDQFFWKAIDAQVKFSRDSKGQIIAAEHHQNGVSFRAPRLPPRPKVELTEAALDAFTAKYDYGSGAILTVTRDGRQLYAQLTGQPKYPIDPKSETSFVWRIVPAAVDFTKGADGKVTKATHHQNGVTFDAPRLP